jgi:hypothetical protein
MYNNVSGKNNLSSRKTLSLYPIYLMYTASLLDECFTKPSENALIYLYNSECVQRNFWFRVPP